MGQVRRRRDGYISCRTTLKAAMDRQSAAVAVIDETKLSELIHEMTDPRPGCADHLGQVILADAGKHKFGSASLPK